MRIRAIRYLFIRGENYEKKYCTICPTVSAFDVMYRCTGYAAIHGDQSLLFRIG